MTPEQAKAALEFLRRSTLQGAEAYAFLDVVRAIEALAQQRPADAEVTPMRVKGGAA